MPCFTAKAVEFFHGVDVHLTIPKSWSTETPTSQLDLVQHIDSILFDLENVEVAVAHGHVELAIGVKG